jgi:lysophospholipase L1-like esterase
MIFPNRFILSGALALALVCGAHAQQAPTPTPTVEPTPTPAPLVVAPEDARFDVPATDDGLPGTGPIHRADWFRKNWIALHKQWAQDVQKDQGALVFLGDSITQGWGDVGSSFPGIKVAVRGVGGDTTRGVLIRLKDDVLALNPSGVVLLIGTNDIGDGVDPEVIAANVKLIIDALKQANPAMPVILCNIMPSSTSMKRAAAVIQKTNALYFKGIADEPQVTVLDTYALFKNSHGDAKDEEMPDLLHPDILGYGKWAAALRPILETNGLVPTWADDFSPENGFTSLFDGHDLTGWEYDSSQIFTRKTSTADGRFIVKSGRLIVTVSHASKDYKKLWTTLKYNKDFVLKLEFRASPGADSGIFIREPQLQCRDFIIAGPFSTLRNYRPLDWNEIVVTVRGGLAHCVCNGEVLVDAMPVPADGPIGLESDHGQVEYRRIRAMEAR